METSPDRTCKKCGASKPLPEFPLRRKRGIDYRSHLCRDCFNARQNAQRAAKSTRPPRPKPYIDPATGIEMKRCTKCGMARPLTNFRLQRGKRRASCNECERTAQHARYVANPEKYRATVRDSAKRHPDKVKARLQQWRAANREHLLASYRRRYVEQKEQRREYDRERRRNLPPEHWRQEYQRRREYALAYIRRWREQNPEKVADTKQRRRARMLSAPTIEAIDRQAIIRRDNSACYLCNRVLAPTEITLDHVIPLSRGGPHTAENLRVACRSCNARKRDRLLVEMDGN